MADQFSFDVVSCVDMQELKNAIDQTMKEIRQRFDFKGSQSDLILKEKDSKLEILSDDEYKLKAVIDILKTKCIKRSVSLKALSFGHIDQALGGTVRQMITIQNGLTDETAKAIVKSIRDGKFKAQAQIQGDQLRIQSKSKDHLQAVIAFLQQQDFGVDLQYVNYR